MTVEYKPCVLVVDDDDAVRASLTGYLENRSMRIASAANGHAAIESIIHEKPDVVLLDLGLPGIDGLEVLRRARQHACDAAIIVISGDGVIGNVIEALRLGAYDYISKPIHDLELLDDRLEKAVERTQILREKRNCRETLEDLVGDVLSEREKDVLRLVAEGKSSKQIAAQLYVTTKTIVWHRQSIMRKLDLRSIAELTKYAVRAGLTTLDR